MLNILGHIKDIVGTIQVKHSDGSTEVLVNNAAIVEGDTIVNSAPNSATIVLNNGREVPVEGDSYTVVDMTMAEVVLPTDTSGAEDEIDLALLGDIDDLETAAGEESSGSTYYEAEYTDRTGAANDIGVSGRSTSSSFRSGDINDFRTDEEFTVGRGGATAASGFSSGDTSGSTFSGPANLSVAVSTSFSGAPNTGGGESSARVTAPSLAPGDIESVDESQGSVYVTLTSDHAFDYDTVLNFDFVTGEGQAEWADDFLFPMEYTTDGGVTWNQMSDFNVTMDAGATELVLRVDIFDDGVVEDVEQFLANVTSDDFNPVSASFNITDNDIDDGTPLLAVDFQYVVEGMEYAEYTISLDKPSDGDVSIDYSTLDFGATAGEDYTAVSGTATILAGETEVKVRVPITDDLLIEGTELAFLNLDPESLVGDVKLADIQGSLRIFDNDGEALNDISVALDSVTEDNVLNAQEADGIVTLSGVVSGVALENGVVVVTIDSQTFSANVKSDGTFSIEVPGSVLASDSDTTIETAVYAQDVDGNFQRATTSDSYDVDTAVFNETIQADIEVAITTPPNDNTPEVQGTTEANSEVTITYVDANGDVQTQTTTSDEEGNFSLELESPLADGNNEIDVSVEDSAGNSASTSLDALIDTVAEAGTVLVDVITGDDIINITESEAATQTVSGTAIGGDISEGDTVSVSVNGNTYEGVVGVGGVYSVEVATADLLADGSVDVSVASQDDVGNEVTSSGSSAVVTSDLSATAAPTVALLTDSGNPTDLITNDGTLVVTPNESGSTIEYSIDNGQTWSSDAPTATEGVNSVSVREVDSAGNPSEAATIDFVLDTQAPDAPEITNIIDANGDFAEVTLYGRGSEVGNIITLYNSGVVVGTALVGADLTWSIDVTDVPKSGNETLSAVETDTAGNNSDSSTPVNYAHNDWSSSVAEASDDYVFKGEGNDSTRYAVDNANDKYVFDGGQGEDTLSFEGNSNNITASLATGLATSGDDSIEIRNTENLVGSSNDDNLAGDTGANTISGGAGDDSIYGDRGDDVILGGTGDDNINGGAGDDVLHGNNGDDYIIGRADNDTLFGDAGDDILHGDEGDDLLYGGTGDDDLSGGKHDDTLFGESGEDKLNGGRGDDILDGGEDNDVLMGMSGDDTLLGGEGDDLLSGGSGDDKLFGGAGDDTLLAGSGDNDTVFGGDGEDTIIYDGAPEEYTVTLNPDGTYNVEDADGNIDVVDEVENITFRPDGEPSVETTLDDLAPMTALVDSNDTPNTIDENVENGAEVGIQAFSMDGTGDTVNYEIVDVDGNVIVDGPFAVDAITGVVTVNDNSLINYETAASHDVIIQANSSDGSSVQETFRVDIGDVDFFGVTDLGGDANGESVILTLSGDHYTPSDTVSGQEDVGEGSPHYQIYINGEPYGDVQAVTANRGYVNEDGNMSRDSREFEVVTFKVPEGTAIDSVTVRFLNDKYDGTTDIDGDGVNGEDRNLFVDAMNIGGTIEADGSITGGTTYEAEDSDIAQYLATNGHDVSGREIMPWAGDMTFYPNGVSIETPSVDLVDASDTGVSSSDNITSDTTPTVRISIGEGAATNNTISISVDGVVVVTHAITTTEWRNGYVDVALPELSDGSHDITASIAGANASSDVSAIEAIVVDSGIETAPGSEPITAELADASNSGATNDTLTNDNTPTIEGDTEAGARIDIIDANGDVIGSGVADEDGHYEVTTDTLGEGSNVLEVKVTDTAGNSEATTITIDVDTIATAAPLVHIGSDNGDIGDDALDSEGNVVVRIELPVDALVGDTLNITAPDGSVTSVVLDEDMIENGYETAFTPPHKGDELAVSATITDQAGNTSGSTTNSVTFSLSTDTTVLLEESFENLQSSNGWHVETGDVVGDSGVVWDTGSNGIEVQRGIVSGSSDGEVHAELDAHHNVSISTNVNLTDSSEYTLAFDVKPRDGGASRDHQNTSDMKVTFGTIEVSVNSDSAGNLSFETNHDSVVVKAVTNPDTGWSTVVIEYINITDDTALVTIAGTGADDSYGMLLDNIDMIDAVGEYNHVDVVTVVNTNDAPDISDETVSVSEDALLSGQIHASDANGDSLTYTLSDGASVPDSFVLNTDGSYTFDADAYDNLSDGEQTSFDVAVSVTDGHGGSSDAVLTVDVNGVNNDLTYVSEAAGYRNVIGFYEVDVDGNPVNGTVTMVIDDQNGLPGGLQLSDMNPDTDYGFFIVAGYDAASKIDADSVLSFDNSGATPTLLVDGTTISNHVYHDTPDFNFDGKDHFVFESDGNGGTNINIEDLPGLGDADFGDVVLNVNFAMADKIGDDVQAKNDAVVTTENEALVIDDSTLIANDVDATGDPLVITGVSANANTHGTVELVNKIAFADNFDDNNADGWSEISFNNRDEGHWNVSDGAIGEQSDAAKGIMAHDMSADASSTNYGVSVDVHANTGDTYNNGVGLVFAYVDANNYYKASWDNYSESYDAGGRYPNPDHYKDMTLVKVVDGVVTQLDMVDRQELPNDFSLRVDVNDNGIEVSADGVVLLSATDQPELGTIGLWTYDNDRGISYDNVEVRSNTAGTEVIYTPEAGFNGDASFEYTVSDGNVGSDSASVNVHVIDLPEITNIVDTNGDYSNVILSGTGEPGATITLFNKSGSTTNGNDTNPDGVDTPITPSVTVDSTGNWSTDISNLTDTVANDNEFFSATQDASGSVSETLGTVHYWHGSWSSASTEVADDYVLMGNGDDTLRINDDDANNSLVVDGGNGYDKAIFNGDFGDFDIQNVDGTLIVTESNGDVNELRNFENVTFNNTVLLVATMELVIQGAGIENLGNIGPNNVNGDNPEDSATRTFEFGSEYANTEVVLSFNSEAVGTWDQGAYHTNDVFTIEANGNALDQRNYNHVTDDDNTWNESHEYRVTLDDDGKVDVTFNVASTGTDETVSISDITVVNAINGLDGTYTYDGVAIDAGFGEDILVLDDTLSIDFDALAANVDNVEVLQVEDISKLSALNAEDIIDLTDGDNILEIQSSDEVNHLTLDTSETWTQTTATDYQEFVSTVNDETVTLRVENTIIVDNN